MDDTIKQNHDTSKIFQKVHVVKFKPATIVSTFLAVAVLLVITLKIDGKSYSTTNEAQTKDYLEIAQRETDTDSMRYFFDNELDEGSYNRNQIISTGITTKEIALTFDDGPHPGYTEKLLAILAKYDIKATFFVVGKKVAQYPKLLKEEAMLGHSIGNHTYSHVNLNRIYAEDAAAEIKACGNVIKDVTGKYPCLFRPPGGIYDKDVIKISQKLGYTMVLWTANTADYSNISENAIKHRLYSRIGSGGIVLMHDGIQKTLDILPKAIETLKARGYRFVTVDEMLARRWAYRRRKITVAKSLPKVTSPASFEISSVNVRSNL